MELLSARAVVSGYRGLRVLHDVDLTVAHGSVTAIIGPNGHGKTTLLRTIAGLNRTWSGELLFEGRPLPAGAHNRARLGLTLVPQGDQLFTEMTVEENLLLGAYCRTGTDAIRASLEGVFELFPRLRERRSQKASGLSGGERRMVGIGRGVMSQCKLMMLDEPSLGLAPLIIEQIYAALGDFARRGLSILVVEENPKRVARIADHFHLMDAGRFAWSGNAADLTQSGALLKTYLGG